MKRNFGKKLIIGAALCCLPFSAMALEALDDSALGGVTGQAGVSIAVDDVVIFTHIAGVTYIDTDGYGYNEMNNTGAAGIRIEHVGPGKLMTIRAILTDDTQGDRHGNYGVDNMNAMFNTGTSVGILSAADSKASVIRGLAAKAFQAHIAAGNDAATFSYDVPVGLRADAATPETLNATQLDGHKMTSFGATGSFVNGISPLTIDIGTAEAISKGLQHNINSATAQVGGVIIGLPTVEIKTYGDTKAIKLATAEQTALNENNGATFFNNANVVGTGVKNEFITVKTDTKTMAILGGRLEITPH